MKYVTPKALTLRRVNLVLAGVGATGSWLLPELARLDRTLLHLGHPEGLHVAVWDGDTVTPVNIGRQGFLPGDLRHNKAVALVHRLNLTWGLRWEAKPVHLASERVGGLAADVLVTCTDSAKFRVELGRRYRKVSSSTLWLDCGNAEHTGQVVLGHLGKPNSSSELRLPNVFDLYEAELLASVGIDTGPSCSVEEALRHQDLTVNVLVAAHAYNLLWNLLRHGGLDAHGVFVDTRAVRSDPLPVDEDAWTWRGYDPGGRKGKKAA